MKFGTGLSNAQMALARKIEAAGLASISQVVKAMERGETEKIAAWKLALEPAVIEESKDAPAIEQTPEAEDSAFIENEEPSAWIETKTGYQSREAYGSQSAAVEASFELPVPTQTIRTQDGWNLFSRYNPTRPRFTHGGAREGAGAPRKHDTPDYNAGYQAGYSAGKRLDLDQQRDLAAWRRAASRMSLETAINQGLALAFGTPEPFRRWLAEKPADEVVGIGYNSHRDGDDSPIARFVNELLEPLNQALRPATPLYWLRGWVQCGRLISERGIDVIYPPQVSTTAKRKAQGQQHRWFYALEVWSSAQTAPITAGQVLAFLDDIPTEILEQVDIVYNLS